MQKQSLTILGLAVILIGYLFQVSGVEVSSERIQTTLEVLIQAVGVLMAWYGRFKQGDITWFGGKKF